MQIPSKTDIAKLLNITQEVSKIIMTYYKQIHTEVERKDDNSPVTVADRYASEYICEHLVRLFPSIPVVSEENKEASNIDIIHKHKIFWLIDPIDGTWSFIRKNGVFTVNIALIESGKPTWGLISCPLDGSIYYNTDKGECVKKLGNNIELLRGKKTSRKGLDFLVSHHNLNQHIQDFVNKFKVNTITPIPSSIKFALIAEGKGDIYPRFKRTCIWDTAAGHALLNSIGGDILDLSGKPLTYNSGNLENPNFVAVCNPAILKGIWP